MANTERDRLIRNINRYREKPLNQVLVSIEDAPLRYLVGIEKHEREKYNKTHPNEPTQLTFNISLEKKPDRLTADEVDDIVSQIRAKLSK